MVGSQPLTGIIPVLSTPILKDGSIDEKGLGRLVEFLISKGAGGFWALGTGSEDMNLSFGKRIQVARIISEVNAGRVPILLGAAFYALEDTLKFINETHDLKIDAFHIMVYHPLLGDDRVEWFYRHIADNSPKPLWMYSSANYGRSVSPQIAAKLRKHPNIQGIKFSTKNTVDIAKVIMLADENFQVITAVAATLYACLCMGVKAHTTSIASCLPEILTNIYDLFQAGKREEALSEQQRLIKFLDALPKGPRKDNFFQAAEEKYILSLREISQEYTTSYYRDLTEQEKTKVRKALMRYKMFPSFKG
jgi:4-hydroxy-tetrahydrodipicolinate synthase